VSLSFNLRMPGQVFDVETGYHYNTFRDYEPGTGRYLESDPIGLAGGVSTFAYARSQPIHATDFFGLLPRWQQSLIPEEVIATVRMTVSAACGNSLNEVDLNRLQQHVLDEILMREALKFKEIRSGNGYIALTPEQRVILERLIRTLPPDDFGVRVRASFQEAIRTGRVRFPP
jgi:RHS repeat-associated protein